MAAERTLPAGAGEGGSGGGEAGTSKVERGKMTLVLPCSHLPVSSEASHWSNSDQPQKPQPAEVSSAATQRRAWAGRGVPCLPEIQIY